MNRIIFFIPAIVFAIIFFSLSFAIKINEPLFRPESLVGSRGITDTSIDENEPGIVYIGSKAIVAKTYQGSIKRNWPVLVVAYDKENKVYKVEKYS